MRTMRVDGVGGGRLANRGTTGVGDWKCFLGSWLNHSSTKMLLLSLIFIDHFNRLISTQQSPRNTERLAPISTGVVQSWTPKQPDQLSKKTTNKLPCTVLESAVSEVLDCPTYTDPTQSLRPFNIYLFLVELFDPRSVQAARTEILEAPQDLKTPPEDAQAAPEEVLVCDVRSLLDLCEYCIGVCVFFGGPR